MEYVDYDSARHALSVACTVAEAKQIQDMAKAFEAYAKQVNDSEMEIWLSEIKIRARRRVGEISKELDKAQGERNDKQLIPSAGTSKKQTLKAAGLSQSVANRCEKIAEIPEEKFEVVIAEVKEKAFKRIHLGLTVEIKKEDTAT